jgi:hypothetical protein
MVQGSAFRVQGSGFRVEKIQKLVPKLFCFYMSLNAILPIDNKRYFIFPKY